MVSAIGGCVVFIIILFSLFSALARRVSGIKPKGPPKIIQIEGTTQLTENLLSDDDILEKTTLERLKQSTDSQDKQRSSIQTEEHFYVEHIKPKLESQYIQDMATRTPKTFKPRLSDMAVVHCTSVRDVNHESGKHLDSNRESKYLLPEQSRESKLLLPEHSRESRLSFNGPNRESFVASAHDPNRESLLVQRSSTPLSTSPQLDIFQNGFPDQICFFTNHINVQPLLDLIEYLYLPANQPYTANSSVEINIEQDHIIQVYQHIYDGWCFGRNMTSGQEGYFPAYCTFPSHPTHLNIFYFSSTSPSPHILDYAYSLFPDRITVYSQTHQDLYPLFNAFDGTELFLVCGDVEFIQPVLEFAEGFAHERWPHLNIHAIADE
ncbi:hypothetical protein HDV02_002207 [Globomyces sp. JEL0801]|nr:hypothetical protein HDV02_002207 [Globomyces sp. JEL0801]